MVYFTSDLHLFHKNIAKYCPGRDSDMKVMVEKMITTWNLNVGKDDEVYILGDISFGKADETREIIGKLNGRKILVMGNHDRRSPQWYIKAGFTAVVTHDLKLQLGYTNVVLSHYPHKLKWYEYLWYLITDTGYTRFQDRKLERKEAPILIHGHNHGKHYAVKDGAIDVGWDVWGRPISETYLMRLINERETKWTKR